MRAFHLVAAAVLVTLAAACEGTNTSGDGAMSAPSAASAPAPDVADSLDSPEPETTNPESATSGPDLPEGAVDPIRRPEGT